MAKGVKAALTVNSFARFFANSRSYILTTLRARLSVRKIGPWIRPRGVPFVHGRRPAQGRRADGRARGSRARAGRRGPRRRRRASHRRQGRRQRRGDRRDGCRLRGDRLGQAKAARRLPRVGLLRLPRPRRRAGDRRQDAGGDAGRRHLRGQPLGPARHQRALPPGRLEAARRAPLDAPPRPLDDLLPDRRHLHALRAARARTAPSPTRSWSSSGPARSPARSSRWSGSNTRNGWRR